MPAQSESNSEWKLRTAWLKSGRSEQEFLARRPQTLDDYEESKLAHAGVDLEGTRKYFTRLKALMGPSDFAQFCGEMAERQLTIESRNGKYPGMKPKNPTGAIINLGIYRVEQPQSSLLLPLITPQTTPAAVPSPVTLDTTDEETDNRELLTYTSKVLVACNLPHTDPGDIPHWVRSNGEWSLIMTRGQIPQGDRVVQLGYPYGTMPRLITIYLATMAIYTRNPTITLGDSYNWFIKRIGIEKSGPNHRMLREQFIRLVNANLRVYTQPAKPGLIGSAGKNATLADEHVLWWDDRNPEQPSLFPNYITLNRNFFDLLVRHGFPVDLDTVLDLRKSPLALDLYGWLAQRVRRLHKPLDLSNEDLQQHLGTDFAKSKDFAKAFRRALLRIKAKWPTLKCEATRGGMRLFPSPTPISSERPSIQ